MLGRWVVGPIEPATQGIIWKISGFLNERVAESDTSDTHDFNVSKYVMLLSSNSEN